MMRLLRLDSLFYKMRYLKISLSNKLKILILIFTISLCFTVSSNTVLVPSANTSDCQNSNLPLGINLSAVQDWTTEWPFVDAFKYSRTWISQRKNSPYGQGGPLNLTSDGWIASLDQDQYAETVIFDNGKGHYPGGQYVLLYDGEGTINFLFDSAKIASQTTGRMLLDVVPQDTGIWLQILATNPANPIRNIKLLMPGFENTYQTQPFHPLFLERMSKFKVIRFMNWTRTNETTVTNWSERATPELYTQASDKGVALEYMLDLANTLHVDPWFNIPHLATDDYVRKFATMVRERLDPSLKPHIEYSNEVWNYVFPQTKYAQEKGLALSLDKNGFTALLRYYSQRSIEIFKIWEYVFGGKERLVRILASQAVNPWTGEQVMTWKSAYKYADAYAIAPYFDGDDLNNPEKIDQTLEMKENQIIDNILNDIRTATKQYITDNYNFTNQHGLKLFAYEGGAGLESSRMPADKEPQVTALFQTVNRNPRMREVYVEYLNMWKESGGALFSQFVNVDQCSKYGCWGALEYQNQEPSTAPKYLGIMDFIEKNLADSANSPSCDHVSAP